MFTHEFIIAFFIVAVVSYLLGSLNFALILSKFVGDDIRHHGSGNAGMTNILRTYGKKPAIITAAGDFLKAVISVYLSRYIFAKFGIVIVDAGYISGLFVMIGHLFPLYFRFKGGKGVIVALAVMFSTNQLVFLVIVLIFIPFVLIIKIVSLASVVGAIVYPIMTYAVLTFQGRAAMYDTFFASIIGLIILANHRENIKRLINGTESKFGSGKK